MTTYPDIDKLTRALNLSPYQTAVLKNNYNKYDMSRLEKRGRALYVPHTSAKNIFARARQILSGRRADLIGTNKTLLRNRRGVRLYAGGYYSVNIGKFTLYADDCGHNVSRDTAIHMGHKYEY